MEVFDPVIYTDKLVGELVPTLGSRYDNIKLESFTFSDSLDSYDFNNCLFQRVNFEFTHYKGVTFIDCLFENCDLSNLVLENCTFKRCRFTRCSMVGISIISSSLEHFQILESKCDYINLANNKMKCISFKESRMVKGRMYENTLKHVIFDDLDLTDIEIVKTLLKGIDISTCQLEGINIDNASIYGAIISPVQAFDIVRVLGVEFR